jgi:hypothetical protein
MNINTTWTGPRGKQQALRSPIAILSVWVTLALVLIPSLILHIPIWFVNGRGFIIEQRGTWLYQPPQWVCGVILVAYVALILLLLV